MEGETPSKVAIIDQVSTDGAKKDGEGNRFEIYFRDTAGRTW